MTAIDERSMSVRYLDTTAAYDLWSDVYDTDGNFLQALDTIEMKSLLPRMLSELKSSAPWKIVDLGCGTGRNTAALLNVPNARIVALDASPGMLSIAKQRLEDVNLPRAESNELHLDILDLIKTSQAPEPALNADAVVSTLVLEHIPCNVFFEHVSRMLKPEGILLVTNMHSHMGGISQAGFVDPKTGEKIRPKSYAHTVQEVEEAASKCGLQVVGTVEEKTIDESMIDQLGERSRKWVGVTCWFGGLFRMTSA